MFVLCCSVDVLFRAEVLVGSDLAFLSSFLALSFCSASFLASVSDCVMLLSSFSSSDVLFSDFSSVSPSSATFFSVVERSSINVNNTSFSCSKSTGASEVLIVSVAESGSGTDFFWLLKKTISKSA